MQVILYHIQSDLHICDYSHTDFLLSDIQCQVNFAPPLKYVNYVTYTSIFMSIIQHEMTL